MDGTLTGVTKHWNNWNDGWVGTTDIFWGHQGNSSTRVNLTHTLKWIPGKTCTQTHIGSKEWPVAKRTRVKDLLNCTSHFMALDWSLYVPPVRQCLPLWIACGFTPKENMALVMFVSVGLLLHPLLRECITWISVDKSKVSVLTFVEILTRIT